MILPQLNFSDLGAMVKAKIAWNAILDRCGHDPREFQRALDAWVAGCSVAPATEPRQVAKVTRFRCLLLQDGGHQLAQRWT